MGKNVLVKCVTENPCEHMRDMTTNSIYAAYLPSSEEEDKDGQPVMFDDEVWILRDDVGDEVVARLSHGIKVIED